MITLGDMQRKLRNLSGWGIENNSLAKEFAFNDFSSGLEFTIKVGEIAKELEHSPLILIKNDGVRIELTTHEENGITDKDFMFAESIEVMLKQ